jgi:hypothetical protein
VRPETLTELVEEELTSDAETAAEKICSRCGKRFPSRQRRCPDDGTPLVMPDTLVELLKPAPSVQRQRGGTVSCVRCGEVFPAGTRRCPRDGTPLVDRTISPLKPKPSRPRRADEATPPLDPLPTADDDVEELAATLDPQEVPAHMRETVDERPTPLLQLDAVATATDLGLPTTDEEQLVPTERQPVLAPSRSDEDLVEQAEPPEPVWIERPARPARRGSTILPITLAAVAAAVVAFAVIIVVGMLDDPEPTSVIFTPDEPDGAAALTAPEPKADAGPKTLDAKMDAETPADLTGAEDSSSVTRPARRRSRSRRRRVRPGPPAKPKILSPRKIKDPFAP